MTRPAAVDYEVPSRSVPREHAVEDRSDALSATLRIVTTVGIALWLGSLAHLLLTVGSLFAAFPKAISSVAVEAAPVIFRASERAGLIVAAVTLAAAVSWNWRSAARSRRWIAWLLAVAATLAVMQTTIVSARMERLRADGLSSGDAFRTLHRASSSQYLVQTALLLTSCALLPAALRDLPRSRYAGRGPG